MFIARRGHLHDPFLGSIVLVFALYLGGMLSHRLLLRWVHFNISAVRRQFFLFVSLLGRRLPA